MTDIKPSSQTTQIQTLPWVCPSASPASGPPSSGGNTLRHPLDPPVTAQYEPSPHIAGPGCHFRRADKIFRKSRFIYSSHKISSILFVMSNGLWRRGPMQSVPLKIRRPRRARNGPRRRFAEEPRGRAESLDGRSPGPPQPPAFYFQSETLQTVAARGDPDTFLLPCRAMSCAHMARWRFQCATPAMGRTSFSRMGSRASRLGPPATGVAAQSETNPNRALCCSQSMGKVRISWVSDRPDGSSPLRMASMMSGANVVSFRMRAT